MKAILVHQCGGPEQLKYEDLPVPAPAAGQALVKLAASGVNFIDIYFREGLYPAELPVVLGMEGAGTVEAVGPDTQGISAGDRVVYAMARGSYAEYAAVPVSQLVRIPEGMSFDVAAAVLLQGMTAHYLTHSTYPLKEGDTAFITAAAGGTGLLLVQMAKMRGARVFGAVSTEEKAERARAAGADEIIFYTKQETAAEVRRLTGGRGVNVVFDSVGAATFAQSMDSLAPRGMMVTFGNASGAVPAFEPLMLTQRGSLFLTRPSLANYCLTREELEWRAGDVLGWAASGRLQVRIDRAYPLAEAAQAQVDLASRRTSGKLLLHPA